MGQDPGEMRKTGQDERERPSTTVRKLWPAYVRCPHLGFQRRKVLN